MRNIWNIAKKEIKTYFTSPIAYVVIGVFIAIWGFFFTAIILWFNNYGMQAAQDPYASQQMNINQMVYQPLFQNIAIFFLLMLPLLTMRLFAEERKTGTEELLFTSPISPGQIIIGKFTSSLLVLLTMLLLTSVSVFFTFLFGNPEPLPILIGYLGLFLMGAAFLSIGIFFSSLTENQVVAAVPTFGALLFLYIVNWMSSFVSGFWKSVVDYISFFGHFGNLTQGILDTTDLVYYFSIIFLGLFLTHSVIQSRRWR